MNSNEQKRSFTAFHISCVAIFGLIIFLILFIQKGWGDITRSLCTFYSLATAFFFLIQLYGFVISQTKYSEEIEEPKFTMLKGKEDQWHNYAQN
ncbi:MAG: hypothetical protein FJ116_06950 [Deltaproteobacteria bacterium]|nr:hypothetical protein [Deltaproteobacteria bacterium]